MIFSSESIVLYKDKLSNWVYGMLKGQEHSIDPNLPHNHKVIFSTKFLDLCMSPGQWVYARRPNVNKDCVVCIIPTTAKKMAGGETVEHIIFLETKRPPLEGKYPGCIEFPAGLIGDEFDLENESFLQAAKRELYEETGYESNELILCSENAVSSPGMTDESSGFVVARFAEKTCDNCGIDAKEQEVIREIYEIPVDQAYAWLRRKEKDGFAVSCQLYAGLGLFMNILISQKDLTFSR